MHLMIEQISPDFNSVHLIDNEYTTTNNNDIMIIYFLSVLIWFI